MRYLLFQVFFLLVLFAHQTSAAGLSFNKIRTMDFDTINKQTGVDITSAPIDPRSGDRGQINIRDNSNATNPISITVQSCGLTSEKVRIKDFNLEYENIRWSVSGDGPFTKAGLPNPGNGNSSLIYGATLVVTKDAKIGYLSPCFSISINYDCAAFLPCSPPLPAGTSTTTIVNNDNADVLVLGAPMVLNDISPMSFGHITRPTRDSDIVLTPDGSASVISGDAILLDGSMGQPGVFEITAEKQVQVSLYASRGSEVQGLRLNNITARINNGAPISINTSRNAIIFTTSASGTNSLKIGATLEMNARNTRFGSYNVPYNINIDYQ